jgi:23S rRNA (guanosine2251-2'-O)-methyltransferase
MLNDKDKNIVFGVNPVLESFRALADDIQEVLLSDAADRQVLRVIKTEALRLGLRIVLVAPKFLDQLVGSQKHQGVIVRVKPFKYFTLDDFLSDGSLASTSQRILLLDGLTDPRNFGALLRTAEAVGIRDVIIPKDRSVDVTPVVIKASAGATQHLRIAKVTNLRRALTSLKEVGYWIVGLNAESGETIYDRSYPSKLAVVLGSEGKGIRPVILRECDFTVSIPMGGKIASLNVAVAGAVFFYEILRQARSVDKLVSKSY